MPKTFELMISLVIRSERCLSTNKNVDFFIDRDDVLQDLGEYKHCFSPSLVAGNILSYTQVKQRIYHFLKICRVSNILSNTITEASKLDLFYTDFNIT